LGFKSLSCLCGSEQKLESTAPTEHAEHTARRARVGR